jgi:hypothetical protein
MDENTLTTTYCTTHTGSLYGWINFIQVLGSMNENFLES